MTPHPPAEPVKPLEPPAPLPRPGIFDFVVLLLGASFGLVLAHRSGFSFVAPPTASFVVRELVAELMPFLFLLHVGIIFFWPVFFVTQWLAGRRLATTVGEWLLGVTWLAAVALTGVLFAQSSNALPPTSADMKRFVFLGFQFFFLTLATLAFLIAVFDVALRKTRPWTHRLSLALFLWILVPILARWALGVTVE